MNSTIPHPSVKFPLFSLCSCVFCAAMTVFPQMLPITCRAIHIFSFQCSVLDFQIHFRRRRSPIGPLRTSKQEIGPRNLIELSAQANSFWIKLFPKISNIYIQQFVWWCIPTDPPSCPSLNSRATGSYYSPTKDTPLWNSPSAPWGQVIQSQGWSYHQWFSPWLWSPTPLFGLP